MRATVHVRAIPRQSKAFAESEADLATHVASTLALLRRCVADTSWTLEALQTEMGLDKSQISRVLNGERPLTLPFLLLLPDDLEALFEQRRAEGFGLIVVPPVHGEQAVRNLVSGLVGVLTAKLPVRAERMARATLPGDPEAQS